MPCKFCSGIFIIVYLFASSIIYNTLFDPGKAQAYVKNVYLFIDLSAGVWGVEWLVMLKCWSCAIV